MRTNITRQGNGAAALLRIGDLTIYSSFDTIIAIKTPSFAVQTDEHFSNTTSKHRKQLGCDGFHRVPEAEFKRLLDEMTFHAV